MIVCGYVVPHGVHSETENGQYQFFSSQWIYIIHDVHCVHWMILNTGKSNSH